MFAPFNSPGLKCIYSLPIHLYNEVNDLFYENVYLPGAYFFILFKAIIASPKSTKVSAIIKSAFPLIANSICSYKI